MSAALALRNDPSGKEAITTGRTRAVLERIRRPDVHLAIWQREGACVVPDLDWDTIEDIDENIDVDRLASTIPEVMATAGYPVDAPAIVTFGTEMAALAAYFATFMACDRLRLRLDVIETDACRKFHADQVTARLLMPLVGPGTQWMRAGIVPAVPEGQLRPGDVGVFKGRIWAEEPLILHRSPPIAETGMTRLLLVIDPLGRDMTALSDRA